MTFVANIMFTYGVALLAAMALGLDMGMPVAGPPPMVPLSAVLGGTMLLAGALSSAEAKKGEPGFVRYMAGVHIGLVMPLVYAGVYAQRAYVARAFAHRAVSLASLSLGSMVTFAWLVALKPKKKVD